MISVTYTTDQEGEELADVDVTTLTREQAHDLRLQLRHELFQEDILLPDDVQVFYREKIKQIKDFLGTD